MHCKIAKAAAAAQEEEMLRENNDVRILSDVVMEKVPKHVPTNPPTLANGAVLMNSTGGTSSIANDDKDPDGRKKKPW